MAKFHGKEEEEAGKDMLVESMLVPVFMTGFRDESKPPNELGKVLVKVLSSAMSGVSVASWLEVCPFEVDGW